MPNTHAACCLVSLLALAFNCAAQSDPADYTSPRATIVKGTCNLPTTHPALAAPAQVAVAYRVDDSAKAESISLFASSGSVLADNAIVAALRTCKFSVDANDTHDSRGGLLVVPLGQLTPSRQSDRAGITNIRYCAPGSKHYPVEAKRKNQQGTVKLRFTVDSEGRLSRTEVASSSGAPALDYIAASGLSKCEFQTGKDSQGTPTESAFEVTYVWKLQ